MSRMSPSGEKAATAGTVPALADGVVRLRALRDADASAIVEQARDEWTRRWTTVPRPYGADDAAAFVADAAREWSTGGRRTWAIDVVEPASGAERYAGTIDLRPRGAGGAEVGYALHPDARGRGVTARALRLVCRRWFDEGGGRVTWFAAAGNFASWRVAWSAGFARHATIPAYLPHPDGLQDAWVASVGAQDDLSVPRTPWYEPAVLERDGVRLRSWRDDDGDDEAFAAWLLGVRDAMATGRGVTWCIAQAADGRVLGSVDLHLDRGDPSSGTVTVEMRAPEREPDVATAALRLVAEHALRPAQESGLGLRRLGSHIHEDDGAGAAALTRAGFTCWGTEPASTTRADSTLAARRHWALAR